MEHMKNAIMNHVVPEFCHLGDLCKHLLTIKLEENLKKSMK